MVDPVLLGSGAATAAQLISFVGVILSRCYSYGCAVAGAPAEAKDLESELASLSGVLVSLQALFQCPEAESDADQLARLVCSCGIVLQGVSSSLESAMPAFETRRMKRAINRAAWPLRRKDTLELVKRLERQKLTLIAAIAADQASSLNSIERLLYESRSTMQQMNLNAHTASVLAWLSCHDYESRHLRGLAARQSNTCEWIKEVPEFRSWNESTQSLLWLYGIPGSGKTVLASSVIDYLKRSLYTNEHILAYFYCDGSDGDSRRPGTLFGSLLSQVCVQLPGIPEIVEDYYEKSKSPTGTRQQLKLAQMETLLFEIFKTDVQIYVVIDGLDEAEQRADLCSVFSRSMEAAENQTKVLITSRRERDIEQILQVHPQISSRCDASDKDIAMYVDETIARGPGLDKMSLDLKREVSEALKAHAQGMFQWVHCQLEEISKLRTANAIRAALSILPKTLEATYERIISKINDSDVPFARTALGWLLIAQHPLKLKELAEAAVLEPGFSRVNADSRLLEPSCVFEICGSLVSYDKQNDRVQLAHHSVHDFLVNGNCTFFPPEWSLEKQHYEVAQACLTYVCLDFLQVSVGDIKSDYPLMDYAAKYWPMHVLRSRNEIGILPMIMLLMTDDSVMQTWLKVLRMSDARQYYVPGRWSEVISPLYIATSYGLLEVVKHLIQRGDNINQAAGSWGATILHAACWMEHPKIVQLLLDLNADYTALDEKNFTPFDYAYYLGNEEIMAIFIRAQKYQERPSNDEAGPQLKGIFPSELRLSSLASRAQMNAFITF